MRHFVVFLLSFTLFSLKSYAFLNAQNKKVNKEEKSILKADSIKASKEKNIYIAKGNVEISNSTTTAVSDEIEYNKNTGWVNSPGEIAIIDRDLGNMFAAKAKVKDDFSQGSFDNSIIIFADGSYLQSKEAIRNDSTKITLKKPIFSICPNEKIVKDDRKAGEVINTLSLQSSTTKIDQEKRIMTSTNSIVKLYEVPIFYIPYISLPLKSNKRKSGFLTPSYVNNSQFGFGLQTPYFVNAAPNIDWIISPKFYQDSAQLTVNNSIHHLTKYGEHRSEIEISNNKITTQNDLNITNRTDQEIRYDLRDKGEYVFTHNSSLNNDIHLISDKDYLRDYNFDFRAYTTSDVTYNYNKNRNFLQINTVKFQELEFNDQTANAPWVLPSVTHHIESKKPLFFNERYALTSNLTAITRESGLQYRRLSTIPEVTIPFNIYGNLIDIKSRIELDYYSLENNYRYNENYTDYNKSVSNYKPEISLNWRLPLIQKTKSNTLMVEPMASLVSSSFKRNFNSVPNEDSNNAELTVNNLFVNDRIAGYDRIEAGDRLNYGVKSAMFNDLGQFELTLGQSYRMSEKEQDVTIRGFNENNKSNIVGLFSYSYPKIFNATYLFQLNESNYSNEVNSLQTTLTLDKFNLSNDYLLLRRGVINTEKIAQNTLSIGYQVNKKLNLKASVTKNLVTNKNLTRSATIEYGGCCMIFRFMTTETNTSNLTKTQRSHSINVTIRGL